MKYKQLNYEERVKIEGFLEDGKSKRAIARLLNRSASTIWYELKYHSVKGVYTAKKAQVKAYQRRYYSKRSCLKVSKHGALQRYVERKLREKLSPERISGRLRRYGITVSSKAIYKYIRHRSLEQYLFWNWNKKKPGRKRYTNGKTLDGRRYIEERPEIVGSGHYEADFIVSRKSTYVLLVVVDIVTRYVSIRRLPNRKHATVLRGFQSIFKGRKVESLTLDNDIAFNNWRTIEHNIDTITYFTHPYCSWEKGLVENTNRWIRCFIPKRTDIKSVSSLCIKYIEQYLNNTPRQCLGYQTALEVELELEKCSS